MPGSLQLVSTPIGNMGDITLRALEILKHADRILAEDTRHSRKLLLMHGIDTPLSAYHDHNKERVTPRLLKELDGGKNIALISDAGTPGIADPGFYLTRACREKDIPVFAIPGAAALLAALTASGLPTDHFAFENFPARKSGKRQTRLREHMGSGYTHCYYISPHMIEKFLADVQAVHPEQPCCLARELTKLHEEFLYGTAEELLKKLPTSGRRGELVFLIHFDKSKTQKIQKEWKKKLGGKK